MEINEPPEGIIITISAQMLKERGYRNWLRNYLDAMSRPDEKTYYMRQGARPRLDSGLSYVYLCIGGRVRFRSYYGGSLGACSVSFDDGRVMSARAWVLLAGPLERTPHEIKMKGFRGFRYTQKLF